MQNKQIITLLGQPINITALLDVFKIIEQHKLKIDRVTRLSRNPVAIEVVVFDGHNDPNKETFRTDLLSCGRNLKLDIAVQEDDAWRFKHKLICFDMDSTLVQIEIIDELARMAGVASQVQKITEAAMQGKIDFTESFRERMALLKGIPETRLKGLADTLPITPGAEKLITTLKKLGFKTAILSGGFEYFGRVLQERLGVDILYANTLDVQDGKTTGKVIGEIVDGKRKADKLAEIARNLGVSLAQVVAVGDGANDIPMLSLAGLGIAFQAKPAVLAKTQHHLTHFGLDGVLYLLGLREEHIIGVSGE